MKRYPTTDLRRVTLSAVMQALADPCRLTIVRTILARGELACHEVPLKVSKATRSHHFTILREVGLIETRTEGTKCLSAIREAAIEVRFPGLLDLVRGSRPGRRSARA